MRRQPRSGGDTRKTQRVSAQIPTLSSDHSTIVEFPLVPCAYLFDRQSNLFAACRHPSTKQVKQRYDARMIARSGASEALWWYALIDSGIFNRPPCQLIKFITSHPTARMFGFHSVDLRHPWEKVARTNKNVSTYLGIAFGNGESIIVGDDGGAFGCRPRR